MIVLEPMYRTIYHLHGPQNGYPYYNVGACVVKTFVKPLGG